MKKILLVLPLVLGACAHDPENLKIVEKLVPVPVPCEQVVEKNQNSLDNFQQGMILEDQVVAMHKGILEQKMYEIELEAAFTRCGGKIVNNK